MEMNTTSQTTTKESIYSIISTLFIFILATVCITFFILSTIGGHNARVDACIDLGYTDIGDSGSMSIYGTCADVDDNLHYVKWECEEDFWIYSNTKCTAKNIIRGDVTGYLK